MQYFGYNPIPVCWSGASMSSHEKNTTDKKCSWAWHESQIRKCGIRTPGSMARTAPDYIIISREVNDYSHAPYAVLDDNYPSGVIPFEYPEDDVDGNSVYHFKWAYIKTIKALRDAYPTAKIILRTTTWNTRVAGSSGDIPNNGTNTVNQFNQAIKEIGAFMGCPVMDFFSCGITLENINQTTEDGVHPNQSGQYLMANKFISDFALIASAKY